MTGWKRAALALAMISVLTASNCNGGADKPNAVSPLSPQPPPQIYGVNLTGQVTTYTVKPDFAELYAQIEVSAAILHPLSGPSAESDWARFASFVGIANLQSVSTGIDISVDSLNLPTVVPFSYSYNSGTHAWTSNFSNSYHTPWVRLKAGTSFNITVHDVASNNSNITTGADFINFVSTDGPALGGASWAISATALPVLQTAADAVQGKLQTLFTKTVTNTFSTQIQPLNNGINGIVTHITDLQGQALVDVTFRVKLANTLIKGPLAVDPAKASDVNVVNLFSGDPEALTKLQTTGISGPIKATLTALAEWPTLKSTDENAVVQACQSLKSDLETIYEYNQIDRLILLADSLYGYSNYRTDPTFFNNATCPTADDKAFLKMIGFELTPLTRKPTVTSAQLNELAQLTKGGAASVVADVQSMFAPQVIFTDCRASNPCAADPTIMVPSDITDTLIGMNATHFGCQDRIRTPDGTRTGVNVAFAVGSDNYVFEAWGKTYVDDGIAKLQLRKAVSGDHKYDCSAI